MSGGAAVRRRRILIIVNPAAGRSRQGRRRLGRIVAALQRRGCAVDVRHAGLAMGGAERLAREAAAEFEVIVAAGGDGTINAVANGLAATQRPLAVLPFGTANVLAHEIGLPRGAEPLAELIVSGAAHAVWPGRIGGRLFLTMASGGFDAEVVAAVNPRLKRLFGRAAFAWAIAACLLRYRPYDLRVRVDPTEHRATTIIAAKGRLYGGPFLVAPAANLGEPVLDLLLFQRSGRIAALCYLGALLLGRLPRRRDILRLRAREGFIAADRPVPVQADGEMAGRLPLALGIAGRPLFLIRP